MEPPPSPHSSAVSGLMQQLKSGEISKMQLFQQIAKLQAAASAHANAQTIAPPTGFSSQPTPPAFTSQNTAGLTATFGNRATAPGPQVSFQPPAAQQQYLSFTLAAPVAPATTHYSAQQSQYPFTKPNAVPSGSFSVSTTGTTAAAFAGSHHAAGAPIVESDAEFLASGVSHDKAPRFSVQEWMATKNRNSSSMSGQTSFVSTASSLYQQQQQQAPVQSFLSSQHHQYEPHNEELRYANSQSVHPAVANSQSNAPSLFSFTQPQRSQNDDGDPTGIASQIRMLNLSSSQHETSHARDDDRYEYNPQRQLSHYSNSSSSNHHYEQQEYNDPGRDAPSNEQQEYIDFTEHFRDDLDNRGPIDNDGNAKGNGNNNNTKSNNNNTTSSLGDDAFHARVTRWKSQKDAVREQMKQQLLQSELDECTFAPRVNPKSTKVAAKLRSRGGQGLARPSDTNSPFAVSERLYQEADNYKAREELAQRVKAEEEADLERECTFKPKINRNSSLTDKVKAKYMDIAPRNHPSPSLTTAAMESTAKELEQCTFYPKVNPISAEMVSAQLYLQQDIYERLSRPCCMVGDSPVKSGQRQRGGGTLRRAGSLTSDDISRDTDSDLASSVASPRRAQDDFYIRSLSPRRRRSSAMASGSGRHGHSGSTSTSKQKQQRPRSAGGIHTDEEKDERARRLDNFLERQHFHEEARRKKIETTKQQLLPAHKPTINKKSLDMMENGRKGDFLERITKYALRKEHDNVKKKSVRVSVSVCLRVVTSKS